MLTTIRTGADEQPAADRRALILLALCLGVLVAQVDTSVVNLAMHSIGATFRAHVAALQWVLDGYNLTYAGTALHRRLAC